MLVFGSWGHSMIIPLPSIETPFSLQSTPERSSIVERRVTYVLTFEMRTYSFCHRITARVRPDLLSKHWPPPSRSSPPIGLGAGRPWFMTATATWFLSAIPSRWRKPCASWSETVTTFEPWDQEAASLPKSYTTWTRSTRTYGAKSVEYSIRPNRRTLERGLPTGRCRGSSTMNGRPPRRLVYRWGPPHKALASTLVPRPVAPVSASSPCYG